MIDIAKLTKEDIGKWVEYTTCDGRKERGRIKSWNDKNIFVVYRCAGEWDKFQEFTAPATNPEYLEFMKEGGKE